ncbi:DUF262 domain-containing protein [Nocardioides ochotonae]|uniref:DUF262 domain-containing protein n=1 Tax=Nocardioides ochotonae TaxID=2685869 RepID=UPI00140D3666|nr:DUF262 domain-containing protein [Nocardioides ochotonae]
MKLLDAGEVQVGKVFSAEYDFTIPDYQRPYAWGKDQTLQLLDDLKDALASTNDEPYFLGSIVLVKQKGSPAAEVIDGQQRLTTLTILCAVLRDLTGKAALRSDIHKFIEEPEVVWDDKPARPRLRLRARDAAFFRDHVQTAGAIGGLLKLPTQALGTDAQKAIRDNAAHLHSALEGWSEDERTALFKMLGGRTYLVVVSTPDLTSAFRIFSVMNSRGLPLTAPDIFKSMVIGDISEDDRSPYANKWEQEEQDLGRDGFAELFGHVRMIYAKERARKELLQEFDEQVLSGYLPGKGQAFVDDVLIPYSDAYEHLITQNLPAAGGWGAVNNWLARLTQLDNNDWRPPALWAMRHHASDAEFLTDFLRRLERLAASLLIRRTYSTPRTTRYGDLLKQLEAGDGLDASAFELSSDEKEATRSRLDGDIYLVNPVRKYVLLRLDELLANQPGVSYQHKMITVEHVLPQNPKPDSEWVANFTEEERAKWTHRLGNLALLNRAKNSEAQRYDFDKKKAKYFTTANGVAIFALTTQVLGQDAWTPSIVQARHEELLGRLVKEWELD